MRSKHLGMANMKATFTLPADHAQMAQTTQRHVRQSVCTFISRLGRIGITWASVIWEYCKAPGRCT